MNSNWTSIPEDPSTCRPAAPSGIWVQYGLCSSRGVAAALSKVSRAICETVIGGEVQIRPGARPACVEHAARNHSGVMGIITVKHGVYENAADVSTVIIVPLIINIIRDV